ncbi:putative carboxymethylenebutenolidase [Streptomyces bingchenggensis BCW-1]|uniref:Putative carboxymethylenebutenolidase n=1 Tax=Streptomyces bingchenggensis (strain BCW-1) TaxID=749414 RepID=D7CFA9_STRBB|nr:MULTISPECIES: dienelactone hydrolase family protein [Streptomyces]ADI13125.1 putative carboxymethylenebutenolidase [Streptomyces bingchenggensis BCW-1]
MTVPENIDLSHLSAPAGGSRRLTGHLARPEGPGPWPGVVAVHEALGVDDVMLRQAERLSRAGYLALMPDLFTQGGVRRCLVPTMRASLSGHGRAYQDIAAARTFLAESTECTGAVGIIGFCMGGAFALMSAGSGGFDVASANYGMLPKELDETLSGACPVVASYGGRDRMLKGAAAKLDSALERLGVVHDVKEYPQAGHAFLNDAEVGPRPLRPLFRVTGMGPHPEAAADAWQRIETFFDTHLKQPMTAG